LGWWTWAELRDLNPDAVALAGLGRSADVEDPERVLAAEEAA
jgi:hypothetical protein